MQFKRQVTAEESVNLTPLIDVVFLLLIFFLLSSQIAPRAPFAVVPPKLESGDPSAPEAVLFMAADGRLLGLLLTDQPLQQVFLSMTGAAT